MKTVLAKIAEFCYKHARLVILFVVLITLVSTYYMMQIKISTNNFDLLPQDSKMIKEFWEVNEDFGAQDRHITLIETPDSLPMNPDLLKSFAVKLDEALMQTGLVAAINYSITDNQKNFVEDFFIKNGLLYLSQSDLDSVLRRFETRILSA